MLKDTVRRGSPKIEEYLKSLDSVLLLLFSTFHEIAGKSSLTWNPLKIWIPLTFAKGCSMCQAEK